MYYDNIRNKLINSYIILSIFVRIVLYYLYKLENLLFKIDLYLYLLLNNMQ